jgi:lipopolysaccharide export system permease protein
VREALVLRADRRGRRFTRLSLYIANEFLFSFLVAFLFFFFIFFINQILLLAEEILSRRVPPFDVLRLIFYSLPSIIALSFPFGSLVGALMAIGRFSSSNEILAFRASGVPNRRVFVPLLILGFVFSGVSFVMNDYFLPLGTLNFGRLYRELIFANPELELESFTVRDYQDAVIVTGAVEGSRINDLVIIDTTEEGERRLIAADSANLTAPGGDTGVLSLELRDVVTHSTELSTRDEYEYTQAAGMEYNILLQDIAFSLRNPGPAEMSSRDVREVILERRAALRQRVAEKERLTAALRAELSALYAGLTQRVEQGERALTTEVADLRSVVRRVEQEEQRPIVDRTLNNYELEFHKKFSIPFACLTFVFFAFPVGLMTRRAGRAVGFGVGLLVSTLYWSLLVGGQVLGVDNQAISPALAMWFPNILIALLGGGVLIWKVRQ